MASTIARPSGLGNGPGNIDFSGGGGEGPPPGRQPLFDSATLGTSIALAGIAMLFIALTSSYVVREGFDPGWRAMRMPALLPWNTGLLLLSGFAMEQARRAARDAARSRWLAVTLLLGTMFLAGQALVWSQLSARGIYMASNAHSSFFYLLTALHGLHILGGIAVVSWLVLSRPGKLGRMVRPAAIYWHFMDGLWVYLLWLLFVWR